MLTTDVAAAVSAVASGGLVAVPTETVYGLAADADNPAAVRRVYAVKGRPASHPVIVHVAAASALDTWARDVPDYARRLVAAHWPGPLTVVLRRTPRAGDHVTGGADTIGLRCPAHPLTRELLSRFDGGVAAPSANRFGQVSPTTAQHVVDELGDWLDPRRDLVLDGGACAIGVESTIVDATGPRPRVLRPGAVDVAALEAAGGVPLDRCPSPTPAPGTLPSHYSPRAHVVPTDATSLRRTVAALRATGRSVGVIAPAGVTDPDGGLPRLAAPASSAEYAHRLYDALRAADRMGLDDVVAVLPDDDGIGAAVRDRLTRAAAGSAPEAP